MKNFNKGAWWLLIIGLAGLGLWSVLWAGWNTDSAPRLESGDESPIAEQTVKTHRARARDDTRTPVEEARVHPGDDPARRIEIEPGSTTETTNLLSGLIALQGRCVDTHDRGIEGAEIFVSKSDLPDSLGSVSARSGADGRFEIPTVMPGRFLQARKEGWSPSALIKIDRAHEKMGISPLRMTHESANLLGILETVDKAPANLQVSLTELNSEGSIGTRNKGLRLVTQSRDDGSFSFSGLAIGAAILRIEGPTYALFEERIELDPGINRKRIELGEGGQVKGNVYGENGVPLSGVVVRVSGFGGAYSKWVFSGADGAYRFDRVPAGPLQLEARLLQGTKAKLSGSSIGAFIGGSVIETIVNHTTSITEGELVIWDPVMRRSNEFSGRIVYARDDSPVAFAQVLASPVNRAPGSHYRGRHAIARGKRGRFTLQNLEDGEHKLIVLIPSSETDYLNLHRADIPDLPLIRAGDAEIVIRVPNSQLASAHVIGQVKNRRAGGLEVIVGAKILIRIAASPTPLPTHAVDSADGSFKIGPIRPGEYRFEVHSRVHGKLILRNLVVGSGETLNLGTIEMTTPGTATLNITSLRSPNQDPSDRQWRVRVLMGKAVAWSGSTRNRVVQVGPLQAGQYRVEVGDGKKNSSKDLAIRSGSNTLLNIGVR